MDHIDLNRIERLALSGQFQAAAALVARHREQRGPSPEQAKSLARRAASADSPKLLALALALWPEALGVQSAAFLSALSLAHARFCLRHSHELRAAALPLIIGAVEKESRDAERVAAKAKARAPSGAQARLPHLPSARAGSPKPAPAPVVVIKRGRIGLRVERAARGPAKE